MRTINTWDTRSILVDNNGRIWSKSYRTLFSYSKDAMKMTGKWVLNDEIKSLLLVGTRLWIGFKNMGVYYLDTTDPKAVPQLFLPSPGSQIFYISSMDGRTLLLGTEHGLYKADMETRTMRRVARTEG